MVHPTLEDCETGDLNGATCVSQSYFAGTLDRYIADTLGAFRRGAPPPVPARRGYDVLRVSYAAIRSFESGRRVAVRDVT